MGDEIGVNNQGILNNKHKYAEQLLHAGSLISSKPLMAKFAGFFTWSSLFIFSLPDTTSTFLTGDVGGCLVSLACDIFNAV